MPGCPGSTPNSSAAVHEEQRPSRGRSPGTAGEDAADHQVDQPAEDQYRGAEVDGVAAGAPARRRPHRRSRSRRSPARPRAMPETSTRKPSTSAGTVLADRWSQPPCSNGANRMPSSPSSRPRLDAVLVELVAHRGVDDLDHPEQHDEHDAADGRLRPGRRTVDVALEAHATNCATASNWRRSALVGTRCTSSAPASAIPSSTTRRSAVVPAKPSWEPSSPRGRWGASSCSDGGADGPAPGPRHGRRGWRTRTTWPAWRGPVGGLPGVARQGEARPPPWCPGRGRSPPVRRPRPLRPARYAGPSSPRGAPGRRSCTGGGPTRPTSSLTGLPDHTRRITATRSAIRRSSARTGPRRPRGSPPRGRRRPPRRSAAPR